MPMFAKPHPSRRDWLEMIDAFPPINRWAIFDKSLRDKIPCFDTDSDARVNLLIASPSLDTLNNALEFSRPFVLYLTEGFFDLKFYTVAKTVRQVFGFLQIQFKRRAISPDLSKQALQVVYLRF